MAADKNITIKFIADGDKDLIDAFKQLATAQAKYNNVSKGTTAQSTRLNAATTSLIAKLTAQGKSFRDLGLSTKVLSEAYQGNKVAIEKMRMAMKKLNDEQGKTRKGARLLDNAFATLRSQMLLFQFAMALGVRQVIAFTKEATKVQDMSRAFNTLQGGGQKASIAIEKLQKATNGTVTQFDLFQQANNAMILGVTKNSDEMAEMFDVAQRLGQALGKDAAHSVESLITGIGRQSRLMLDNIGIIVDSEKAYESYAEANGLVASKLTDAEKKQAFFTATMESARKKVGQLGEEQLSNNQRLAQMSIAINDAAISLGELLMPLVIPLAKGLELIARGAGAVIDAFNLLKMGGAAEEFDSLTEKQKSLEDQIDKTGLKIVLLGGEFREVLGVTSIFFENQNSESQRLIEKYNELNLELQEVKQEILDEPSGVQSFLAKQLEEINKLFEEMEKKSLKAGDASVVAAMRAGAAHKNAGLAAQEAAEKELIGIAQAVTARAINSVLANLSIPFPANLVVAAGAGAAAGSLLQGAVSSAKSLKFEQGGLVGGRRHSQGGTLIEAEQGEFVMSRNAVQAVGIEAMNRINQGGGAGSVNISFSGNVMSQDFIEGEAIPMIKEAIRRGADIGVS